MSSLSAKEYLAESVPEAEAFTQFVPELQTSQRLFSAAITCAHTHTTT